MPAKPIAINAIHHLDCIEAMQQMAEGCVDLAFADPPFNIGYEYDVYDDGMDPDTYLGWCKQWMSQLHRVLKPDGTFWLAIGDEYAAELKVIAQREVGFRCRSWVIWYYTFGVNCKQKFSRSHAHLFHFVKDEKHFTFNDHDIRIPSARMLVYGDGRANPQGRLPDDTWILRPQDMTEGFQTDEDVWYFPRVAGTFKERAGFHGCQMPEQLLGRIIRACSNPGELVIDPFAGSSTTLAVAKKLERNFIGFDISPEYVKRGNERLTLIQQGDELEGAAEPRVSAPKTSQGRKRNADFLVAAPTTAPTKRTESTSAPAIDADLEALIIEAYRRQSQGYSVDRVVADPGLNAEFILACHSLGSTLPPAQLNLCLFRLRKAGRLGEVPTTRRTEFTWAEYDQCLFASEIAWKQMLDQGCAGLDDILRDPLKAAQFDQLAAQLAPGFEPLLYRWSALRLRKLAHVVRNRAKGLPKFDARQHELLSLEDLGRVEGASGLYVIRGDEDVPLYAGETLDLAARLRSQVGDRAVKPLWKGHARELRIERIPISSRAEANPAALIACQSQLIGQLKPRLNLELLSAL
jgi:site-specific DNA-methyltransferase (adenine-specific)